MTGDAAGLLQQIVLRAVPVVVFKRSVAATPSPWRAASTMPRLLRARRPQLLPLVLRRAPPLGEEDLERVVRQISSPCCTLLTCVKLVKPRTLAGLRRRSRACRSDFGDVDFSCGVAEAYVPAWSSCTEPAARVRMLEAKGTTPEAGLTYLLTPTWYLSIALGIYSPRSARATSPSPCRTTPCFTHTPYHTLHRLGWPRGFNTMRRSLSPTSTFKYTCVRHNSPTWFILIFIIPLTRGGGRLRAAPSHAR